MQSCKPDLGVPVEVLYRSDVTEELAAVIADDYPAVVAQSGDTLNKLLGRAEIDAYGGNVDEMRERIEERLSPIETAA